jgi:hypothetical protein
MMLLLLLSIQAAHVQAKSWRVNNDETRKAHFTDINAAMASEEVVDGDTLYMDPGCTLTSNQTVTKQVTIVGCGYLRTDAPHRFAYITGILYLRAAHIKVEGLIMDGDTYIDANYCTIERCKTAIIYITSNSKYTAQYATIRQCYSTRVEGRGAESNNSAFATIENCIIRYTSFYGTILSLYTPTLRNNYLKGTYNSTDGSYSIVVKDVKNATIVNNIIVNASRNNQLLNDVTNSTVTNNVMSCAEATYSSMTETNRFTNSTAESAIFACKGINEAYYQLKDDSPAKGFAMDGGDCGPYGGRYPYVPSGFPLGLPRIESSSVSKRSQDGQVSVTQTVSIQKQ